MTTVNAFKYLVFYPLWICSLLFFASLEEEVAIHSSFTTVIQGDAHLALEIAKEPKLVDRWIVGKTMKATTTTNYMDEQEIRRHIIGLQIGDEPSQHLLTTLYSVSNHHDANYTNLELGFYLGGSFYDMNFRMKFLQGTVKRFTQLQTNVTTATIIGPWRGILKLGGMSHEAYLEDCLILLGKEIQTQYNKKLELLRDFKLEEDAEALKLLKKSEQIEGSNLQPSEEDVMKMRREAYAA